MVLVVFLVVLGVVWVVLGVVLEQVEAVAKPLLVPVLKKTGKCRKGMNKNKLKNNWWPWGCFWWSWGWFGWSWGWF